MKLQLTKIHKSLFFLFRPTVLHDHAASRLVKNHWVASNKKRVNRITGPNCGVLIWQGRVKCSYCTSRVNIIEAVLNYSTGKLAPETVIMVVPLEQVRKEGSRVSL